ncbi:MAG TPA: hypothetical protein VGY31_03655 [Terriglobia bacterium]|nr:hypothetical protein [Terriglobia bacterium]
MSERSSYHGGLLRRGRLSWSGGAKSPEWINESEHFNARGAGQRFEGAVARYQYCIQGFSEGNKSRVIAFAPSTNEPGRRQLWLP